MKREHSAGIIVYKHAQGEGSSTRLYLLLQYPKGYWDLVKGKREGQETDEETAHRELREETGLEVTIDEGFKGSVSYTFTDMQGVLVDKEVIYFTGEAISGRVVLSAEHSNYRWLPFNEALPTLTYPVARRVLSEVEQFLEARNRR